MASPMPPATFLSALRAEGLRVVTVGDWDDHNRNHKGPWGPMHGVMIHHTVTRGTARTVEICRKGYASLPGPLCHGVIAKDGTVYLVGYGRANHAGSGDDDVLRAVIDERPLPADNEANTDGNRHFYGFECENLGDGEDPWPAAQLEAIERAAAAVCRHHGWSERSVIGHLEWQPGKVDPRGFTMASMRDRINARLEGADAPAPSPNHEEEEMPSEREIAAAVMEYQIDDPRTEGTKYVPVKSVLWWAGADSAQANTTVKQVAERVKALEERTLSDDDVQRIAAAVAALIKENTDV